MIKIAHFACLAIMTTWLTSCGYAVVSTENTSEDEKYDLNRFEEVFLGKPQSFVRERLGAPDEIDIKRAGSVKAGTRTYNNGGWNGTYETQATVYRDVYKQIWRYDNKVDNGSSLYLIFDDDANPSYLEEIHTSHPFE